MTARAPSALSASAMSDPRHEAAPEQSGRPPDQYGDDDRERDREFDLVAHDIGANEIAEHADRDAAKDSPERAVDPAEHRASEGEQHHPPPHVAREIDKGARHTA